MSHEAYSAREILIAGDITQDIHQTSTMHTVNDMYAAGEILIIFLTTPYENDLQSAAFNITCCLSSIIWL